MQNKSFVEGVVRRYREGTLTQAPRAMERHAQRAGSSVETSDEEIRLLNIMCSADEVFVENALNILNNPDLTQEEKDKSITQSQVDVIKRAGKMVRGGIGTSEQIAYFSGSGVDDAGSYKISNDARMVHGNSFQKNMEKSVKRLEMKDKIEKKKSLKNKNETQKMSPEELKEANSKADAAAASLIEELEIEELNSKSNEGKHAKKAKNSRKQTKRR